MSMMGTLGKVAMGIMVAKGVGKMMGGGSSGGGGLLGSLLGGGQQNQSSGGSGMGGLSDLLGSGGLGGLLGGGGQQNQSSGSSGGGLGDLLGSLAGGSQQTDNNSGNNNDFASMFNEAIQGKEPEPTPEQDQQAQVMLRAMVSAAKADGQIDAEEQKKIIEHLGDVSNEDAEMVRNELQAPLDLNGLINSVPSGMEQQVYLMSLLAIDLDSKEEAVYLDKLAKGLNISNEVSNVIHQKLGAPQLYS